MIIKNTNGFLQFTFQSIQEVEMVAKILPIPNLVPYGGALTFIPEAQSKTRIIIAGDPLNNKTIPTKSNTNIIKGFAENGFCYNFATDGILPKQLITQKVELSKNKFGKYYSDFLVQPFAMCGFNGRVADYECIYNANTGLYVFDYIRFE